MPGKIIKVMVAEGSPTEFHQPLLVIEAMKMQNEIRAPRKGTVVGLSVLEGQAVPAGALLLALE
jgi:biotin carboxyl carrier protein